MTTEAKHSPLPFTQLGYSITNSCGDLIAETGTWHIPRAEEAMANAAFIVRAVNCHDDLVAALIEAKKTIRALHGEPVWDIYDKNSPEMKKINAALAKARGEV